MGTVGQVTDPPFFTLTTLFSTRCKLPCPIGLSYAPSHVLLFIVSLDVTLSYTRTHNSLLNVKYLSLSLSLPIRCLRSSTSLSPGSTGACLRVGRRLNGSCRSSVPSPVGRTGLSSCERATPSSPTSPSLSGTELSHSESFLKGAVRCPAPL